MTEAIVSRYFEAVSDLYASDAVAITPDQGEIRDGQEITQWLRPFLEEFPDARMKA